MLLDLIDLTDRERRKPVDTTTCGALSKLQAKKCEKGVIVVARSAGTSAHKPTAAPLLTSTPLPPLAAVKPTVAPTKAPAIIVNKPPKLSSEHLQVNASKVQVSAPIKLPTPPTNASAIQAEGSPRQANPLQVTGFITKNGNIYEVTDMNGIGMIESRQSPESDKSSYVCNYGSLVIYSDVPCNEVSNVRIGEVHHPVVNVAHREQNQEAPQQSSVAVQQESADNSANNDDANSNANSNTDQDDVGNAEDSHPAPAKKRRRVNKNSKNKRKHNDNNNVADSNSDSNEVDDFNSFDDIIPEPVKKRRRVNKNSNTSNKRRRTGYNNQSNSLRQGTGNRRRQQAQQQQKRRRPQYNRSKSQQQRRRLQHRNQNGIRNGQRGQSYNRRRYSDYYDYEY
ncbi:GATA zinc finger domain-containing protein 14 [Anastrepha obliqua]|uniref:GATA zinc finger domain-containing protein 14 n=1 Tax=Anastrepha obliqua TaxID=95512 RepID=UPI002409428B|nr:GATA zinc finger domain-containing protein 14 [Anastrepha obliqua]